MGRRGQSAADGGQGLNLTGTNHLRTHLCAFNFLTESAMDELIEGGGVGGGGVATSGPTDRPDSRGSSNFDSTAEADNDTAAEDEETPPGGAEATEEQMQQHGDSKMVRLK